MTTQGTSLQVVGTAKRTRLPYLPNMDYLCRESGVSECGITMCFFRSASSTCSSGHDIQRKVWIPFQARVQKLALPISSSHLCNVWIGK